MEFRGKREGKRDGGQNRMLKENGMEECRGVQFERKEMKYKGNEII